MRVSGDREGDPRRHRWKNVWLVAEDDCLRAHGNAFHRLLDVVLPYLYVSDTDKPQRRAIDLDLRGLIREHGNLCRAKGRSSSIGILAPFIVIPQDGEHPERRMHARELLHDGLDGNEGASRDAALAAAVSDDVVAEEEYEVWVLLRDPIDDRSNFFHRDERRTGMKVRQERYAEMRERCLDLHGPHDEQVGLDAHAPHEAGHNRDHDEANDSLRAAASTLSKHGPQDTLLVRSNEDVFRAHLELVARGDDEV